MVHGGATCRLGQGGSGQDGLSASVGDLVNSRRTTHAGPFAAHRVADLLAVSTQAVWKWVAEYNSLGPSGLDRKGRGGRRWGLMTLDEERAFLAEHLAEAETGDLLTAKQLSSALSKKLGQEISVDYIYG